MFTYIFILKCREDYYIHFSYYNVHIFFYIVGLELLNMRLFYLLLIQYNYQTLLYVRTNAFFSGYLVTL